MLIWKKRCRKDQTMAADRKIWETKCIRYRVCFSHIRYGLGEIPDCYYAEESYTNSDDKICWRLISKHRKKLPAHKSCEKAYKEKISPLKKRNPRKK